MNQLLVSDQEFHTIIAALRFYQEMGQGEPANRSDDIHDLATNGEETVSLDAEGIDDLTERINFTVRTVPDTDPRVENLTGEDPAYPRSVWRELSEAGTVSRTYWAWAAAQSKAQRAAGEKKTRNIEVMVCEAWDGDAGQWHTEYLEIPADSADEDLDRIAEEVYRANMKPDDTRNVVRVVVYCSNDPFECEDLDEDAGEGQEE